MDDQITLFMCRNKLYDHSKDGFNKFDNKFDWYIRNIIIKELNI